MWDSLFLWIGTFYREGLYLGGSKVAGIVCSYADILVVALFLRIMDVVRRRPPSKYRYAVLGVFALLTPTLLLPRRGLDFFVLQFAVLAPPYFVLIYTAAAEARHFVAHVKKRLQSR